MIIFTVSDEVQGTPRYRIIQGAQRPEIQADDAFDDSLSQGIISKTNHQFSAICVQFEGILYNLVGGIVEQEHNVQPPMQTDVVQGVFIITVLSLLLRYIYIYQYNYYHYFKFIIHFIYCSYI